MESVSSLGHKPTGKKWEFDESVTQYFEDMLERSIPGYRMMRDLVTALAVGHAQRGSWIVDLGTSTGEALVPILEKLGATMNYVGIEVSQPMREKCRAKLSGWEACGVLRIEPTDLRKEYPKVPASVVLSVLTLQFTPIEYRQRIVSAAYESLRPGGAMILVEKILGCDASMDELLVSEYYKLKGAHGYTGEEIARKRESLEGVLVPVTAAWNEDLLKTAGFKHVECFWRVLNFAAWVAVK